MAENGGRNTCGEIVAIAENAPYAEHRETLDNNTDAARTKRASHLSISLLLILGGSHSAAQLAALVGVRSGAEGQARARPRRAGKRSPVI
jgi:hypothetical protein